MHSSPAQPIAIVGIAAALPGSGDDLAGFAELLDTGRDLVGPVPDARRRDAGLDAEVPLSECALLDRIDTFDHAFFGLSLREARQMDPQQRLLLQLSCQAIWDSGYALEQLKGSRTAVVFGAASESYSALLDPAAAPLVTGLLPAAQAGRVAHTLDLRGPALTVDTACSSSLAAVLEACRRLAAGDADWAVAGGVRLMSSPPTAVVPGNESIVSPGGRARSFDAAADGTGLGEGGAVFLLKPLARAQEDDDPIHAVILGGASNHDGGRSNGFAAPSAQAQEELLLEAWRTAGVHPNSLGLIEAHGTGTRLGDPIEFQALSSAFARRTDRTQFCVLSSVKSNLGHLDSAAGAAGLLKAVVAVKTGRRYASAHFTEPNPLLETEKSALRLSSRTEPWDAPAQRRAGVSAFGLTGTNVHLVVEQAPQGRRDSAPEPGRTVLVPVSARSESALRRHAGRLAAHLRRRADPSALADLAWVQAAGRDHERWRAAVPAGNAQEAIEALEQLAGGGEGVTHAPDSTAPILLLPHEGEPGAEAVRAWLDAFPALKTWQERHRTSLADATPAEKAGVELLLAKLTLVQALLEAGLSDRILIGHGSGNLLVDVLRGESDLRTAAGARAGLGTVAPPDAARTEAAFATISAQGDPVFVTPWPGQLSKLAGELAPRYRGVLIEPGTTAQGDPREQLLDLLAALHRAGVTVDWARCVRFLGGYGRRTWVPTALFEPTRCWVEQPYAGGRPPSTPVESPEAEPEQVNRLTEGGGTEAERKLAAIWCALLDTETVSREDDFFDLGGDSLMQTQMDNAVERDFGVTLQFEAVYDYPRLHQLAAHLESLAPAREADAGPKPDVGPEADPSRTRAPATHSQRRMWLLQQLDPKAGAYNVGNTFVLDGPVDAGALRQALDGLVARHGILRTRLVLEDGELTQRVEPAGTFDFTATAVDSAQEDVAAHLREHAAEPFDLAEAGAARALLLTDRTDPARGWFQLVLHHAICDEWSMNLLLTELTRDYEALSRGEASPVPAPALQFTDWAAWERRLDESPAHAEDARYWQERLAGVATELPLPTDFPHGAQQDYRGAWLTLSMPAELVTRVREAARGAGGTLFTWLLTGYAAWLARVSQAEDFLIGVPVAGRHHAEAEQLPGCFINTLPVHIDASGDPGFSTLFERVRAALSGAFAHQRYPFDLMVEQLGAAGDASRPPLVQTLLSLQGGGPGQNAERRLAGTPLRPFQTEGSVSWFDLSAVLWETGDGGLSGIFAYRTALFEEATIRSFCQDWTALVEAGLTNPHESIHTLLHDDDAW
ncbi:condensation domain-containing protein [Streptomyces sp. 8N616]|uniref:condensation domain-containing protein n=1 Tax=Streptomyces sp. 8N616 TaxID=3457414 RepID=UPI003FD03288